MRGTCEKTCKKCLPRQFATNFFWKNGTMIVNSQFLKSELSKTLHFEKLTNFEVVYPPVEIKKKSFASTPIEFDVVFVGRLEPSKGIIEFLKSINSNEFKIGVGGIGELDTQLKAEFPKVNFLGSVDGIDLMSKARVLIVPSLWNETFGRVVLEGVAVGIPVLISRRGALSEFKSRKGSILIEFNPKDPHDVELKLRIALKLGRNQNNLEEDWIDDHYLAQLNKFRSIVISQLAIAPGRKR